ncbi:hypothetical protein PybrP1_002153 [[Pythium] brassicae (nom. inval.)]|nr:hypothetical protein PybrP1_002153 [[Pythium] brassicae (nom. inval.)]
MVVPPPSSVEGGNGPSELSKTAKLLSQMIEREAKRSSRTFRLRTSLPTFKRNSHSSHGDAGGRSGVKRSAAVGPTPNNDVLSSAQPPAAKHGSTAAPSAPFGSRVVQQTDLATQGSKIAELQRMGSRPARSFAETDANERRPVAVTVVSAALASARLTRLQRLWLLVDEPQSSQPANYISVCVFGFVLLSTVVFIAQTEESFASYASELHIVELILAIENAGSFGAIRIVRLTRVARVLKISRYSSAIQVFVQAIVISIKALSMLIFLMSIAMIVFSSLVYFSEYTPDGCRDGGWMGDCDSAGAEPQLASSIASAAAARAASATDCVCVDPNPYTSIASSFWWCVVTMSTVGYGDMTPVTLPGKIVGCATMLTGTLVLALPISVIGTNFQKVMKSVMQQTMKSNVDFLKGKRMLCRTEIEAILQRFHAVTEDIHLDVDDVINVYDEDNNGMLEDEELQKFRIDLEILQNRLLMSQSHGGSTTPPAGSSDADRSLQSGTALPVTAADSPLRHRVQFNAPSARGPRRASVSSAVVRPFLDPEARLHGQVDDPHRRRAASAISSSDPAAPVPSLSGPENLLISPAQRAREVFQSTRVDSSQASLDHAEATTPVFFIATSTSGSRLARPDSLGLARVVSDDDSRCASSPQHHKAPPQQDDLTLRRHSHQQIAAHGPVAVPRSAALTAPAAESEVFWMRMLEMQHALEERLLVTEQRLEAKLQILTKILVRLEERMDESD